MGRRSRRRRGRTRTAPQRRSEPAPSRAEQRNIEVRAGLESLAPGERPAAVTVAAIVAAMLALTNLAALAAGVEVQGRRPGALGVIAFSAVMLVAAAGMWRARYWAILGFQMLLALIVLFFSSLLLLAASSVTDVLLCLALVGGGGLLFYRLIRAMARIQMPARRPPA